MALKLPLNPNKRVLKYLFTFFLLVQVSAYCQVNFTSSNLPIVLITTDIDPATGKPLAIPDDPKVSASMKIIYHKDGSRNFITDADNKDYLNYSGRIKIELRGSTSQDLPKKQYGWTTYEDNTTTKKKVSIMGMPKQNDWILNGLAYDPSLLRDYLSYNLSRSIGYYTVRTQYCEMVLNGVYKGLYILQEKIKDDADRVNIEAIDKNAADGAAITGGYITKADKTTGGDPIAWLMDSYANDPIEQVQYIHELPKPEDVTPAQNDYIKKQFTDLETLARNKNADFATGFPSIIDVPTFVDFVIMSEYASNVDSYQKSTFFHKDKGGKLRAGPIWDFNLTYGRDAFGTRSKINVWQFDNNDNDGSKFWKDLFDQDNFKCYLAKRWYDVTSKGQPLNYDYVDAYIDTIVATITEAAVREQQTWNTVGNHAQQVKNVKNFIKERIAWINSNIGSFSGCNNVATPPLVISKINYNPAVSAEFTNSDDQEFIAIKNIGSNTVNLTGIYLKELGVSYQFPAGSSVAANDMLYIVSNPEVFKAKYQVNAFGQFQRRLSNSSQNLVLADGFGNVIDQVNYSDTAPWPNADGNGNFLQLTNVTLDNALASSWVATATEFLDTDSFSATNSIVVYPNPVRNILTIKAQYTISSIEVYDIYGKQIKLVTTKEPAIQLDLSDYSTGIYIVKITTDKSMHTQKVIKQ